MRHLFLSAFVLVAIPSVASAQDNYEIQVYGADLVAPHTTMVEVHSNFAVEGRKTVDDGVLPTNHALHETLEVTHGFDDWFETGFYLFTSARGGQGYDIVGSHVRPRFSVPARYHLPVGISVSQEIGYQRREYSAATWTYELRPIIDQTIGRFYWTVNPVLERALKGDGTKEGFEFGPNVMVTYDFTDTISGGLEYYGGFGPLHDLQPFRDGEQQLFPAININFGPDWEFNAGVGFGLTDTTDRLLMKVIVGRRFGLKPIGVSQ